LLLEKNQIKLAKKHKDSLIPRNRSVVIKFNGTDFGGNQIHILLGKLYYVINTYKKACRKIDIVFTEVFKPKDKLTYVLLEYIVCMLYKECGYNVNVRAKSFCTHINTVGFDESILCQLLQRKITLDTFCERYIRELRLFHFRRIIPQNDSPAISELMFDVKAYLKNVAISVEDASRIASIVSELADNACEHARSDCLVDIDVARDLYTRDDDPEGRYYSVNICVLNFSDNCLGDMVKWKINNKKYDNSERYDKLEKAYCNHKLMFEGKYNEDYFFMISTFQNRISGRLDETETGGKGLTELLSELETNICDGYVMSGDKVIVFHPELIEYNEDGWVGFNECKDFINMKPDDKILNGSDTYLSGTGYNLTLIYRRTD
jgi:hypothetical protein